jgi:erythromycin esterase-like protein
MEDLIKLVSEYEIIGLGEATHGNYKNSRFRVNIIKKLIKDHGVREIFFEAEVFRIKLLNNLSGNELHTSMNKLPWIFDNKCTRELCEFVYEFNKHNQNNIVILCGVDSQAYNTENDISDNTPLGKAYKKWGKYLKGSDPDFPPRSKSMAKLFEEQHKDGKKAVLLFHNFHLNKSEKYKDMGYYIYKTYKDKYICIANTFTRGKYHGLCSSKMGREFQDVEIDIPNTEYTEEKPTLYYPPPKYVFGGSAQVDNRYPNKYFTRMISLGWDAVICINNETPLIPYSKNAGVQYFKKQ